MIRLHQFEVSPFCDKVRRILHVKAQPYQVVEVPVSQSLPRLRRLSPTRKLPFLELDGERLADSTDIAHALEERFPEPPLIPADPRERALCHVLEDWADESLYFYEMTLRFTVPANARRFVPRLLAHDPPFAQRLLAPIVPRAMARLTRQQGVGRKPRDMLLRDVERHLEALAGLLGAKGDGEAPAPPTEPGGGGSRGPWLVGDRLSLADLAVFAQLDCIRGTEEGGRLVEAQPAVAGWLERVDRASRAPDAP